VSTSSSSSGTSTGSGSAKTWVPATKSKGYNDFVKHFDNVVGKDATYGRYRNFLTRIAKQESGYNPLAKNKFAPAYGYFQFMQDGKKWNNIQHYSGLSIEAFQNDPEAQIRAGHKLAESFLKSFTPAELAEAKRQGFSEDAILAGCFMGGAGGVKKALKGIDTSDKHWDPEGKQGSSVLTYMHMFNK
jgi:hypothetical protein